MKLENRIEVLARLKEWLLKDDEEWKSIKKKAFENNKWFTLEFVDHRAGILIENYLDKDKLKEWIHHYHIDDNIKPQKIGIVMAGNIPLVGFHDFLCAFVAGHYLHIKLSDKDHVLLKQLIDKMIGFDARVSNYVFIEQMLNGCDAYIATGSNNTSRYFEYYFGKYPSLIRRNRTSVSILKGSETREELALLADDIFMYFGLGCRNVTQLYVPQNYDFVPLLAAFKKYEHLKDHTKFHNNYDYNLALLIMNDRKYMSTDCVVLVEGDHLFSPVSELYYSFFDDQKIILNQLLENDLVQCIVGSGHVEFGQSQDTGLFDYADGIDTMQFLLSL